MAERESRRFAADLEVRASGEGRTVVGICCPFDELTEVGGFSELVRRGAFRRTIAERGQKVKFLAQHDYEALPLGRASLLREDAAGLYGEFRVSKTTAGDEVLELVRDGALDAFSIGFVPIEDRWKGTTRELLEVKLLEVSAVSFPAYAGAVITGTRSAHAEPDLSLSTSLARRRLHLL